MNSTAVYLIRIFFYRIVEFLRHWYVRSFLVYMDGVIGYFHKLDRVFAWKITLENLFQPLYKDYTVVGYILGFSFRLVRLVIAGAVYGAMSIIVAGIYLVWVLLLPYLIVRIFI